MKFSVERVNLLSALGKVRGVVKNRGTMPILSNVLIWASKQTVGITATDLETHIKVIIPATVAEAGETTVSGAKLIEIARAVTADTVEVTLDETKVRVKAGRSRFSLGEIPAKDYPAFPRVSDEEMTPVDGAAFKEMLKKTVFAVSTDLSRHSICGVFIERHGESLGMAGIDGHRLSLIERRGLKAGGGATGAILPREAALNLVGLLDGEGDLLLEIGEKRLAARIGSATMVSSVIDGEFPDVRKAIPRRPEHAAVIDREALVSAIRRASIVMTEREKAVRFSLAQGVITVSGQDPSTGESAEEIDMEYRGEKAEFSLNARYVIEALSALSTDKAEIGFGGHLDPVLIRPAGGDGHDQVIMPVWP